MIGIYQVRADRASDFGFLGFDEAEEINGAGSVVEGNYDLVYEVDFESSHEMSLDDIYEIFNVYRPDGFAGHSMSVSDVIRTPDGWWYCDSVGWKKLDWHTAT